MNSEPTPPNGAGSGAPLPEPKIDKLLRLLDEESRIDINGQADRALWHALTKWKKELPALDDYFHKAFRQTDVTDCGHADMIIWNLLGHSERFWRLFEAVANETQPNRKSK